MSDEDFYRGQTFDLMKGQLDRIENKQEEQSRDISDIRQKLTYIAGVSATLGFIGGAIISLGDTIYRIFHHT